MTERPVGQRKPPRRVRVSFRDDPRPWATIALPARRVWQLSALFGSFAVGLLTLAGFDFADAMRSFTGTDGGLLIPVLDGFTAIIWLSFGLLSLGVALITAFGKEEMRSGHGLLVHVARIGPLRVFGELHLALVRDVRTVGVGEEGDSRVYFEYSDHTMPFGSRQPGESADLAVEFIQRAIAAQGGERPLPVAPHVHDAPPTVKQPVARGPAWLSIAFLVGANLIPIVGVLALGWDLGQLMVLFWIENAVIGFYGLAKLIVVDRWLAAFTVPFFIGHFGFFMALHFMGVYYLFVAGMKGPKIDSSVILALLAPLWTTILAIFVSHGVSFVSNFLGRREYEGRNARNQMAEPYRRVVLLQMTILVGGWAVLLLGEPIVGLLLLVALKIGMDLRAHLRERRA